MKKRRSLAVVAVTAAIGATLATGTLAQAQPETKRTTIAVFGDLPYTPAQIASFDNLSASVNADPNVSRASHLGDIKSGSTLCENATVF